MQCAWQSVLRVDLNQHDTPRALRLVQFSILHFLSWEKPSLNLSASSGISQQIHSDCTVLVRSQTAASGPHFCSSWNKLPAAERLSAVLRVVALWKIDARSWLAKTLLIPCTSARAGPAYLGLARNLRPAESSYRAQSLCRNARATNIMICPNGFTQSRLGFTTVARG